MIDFDALVLAPCHATFGETVYYYPGTGPMLTLTCPFDDKFAQTSFQNGDEIVSTKTTVNLRMAALAALNAKAPVKGELFLIRGVRYVINEVEPDGFGDIRCYLGMATDTDAKRIPLPPS